jgi:hypothetical protein
VRSRIEDHFVKTGGFGTLLIHAGRDYATREKRAQSMAMFMREVAPKVAHLDPDAAMVTADAAE